MSTGARRPWLLVVAAVLLMICLPVSLGLGAVSIEVKDVLSALLGELDGPKGRIVTELRLPRVLLSALVGGGLAVVGASLQAVMKSPLADPYILGVSSGAATGASLAVVLGLGSLAFGGVFVTFVAFAFGVASAGLVYQVARIGGRVSPLRLLLAGVAFSSFATAASAFILFLAPEATQVRAVFFWLLGGFGTSSLSDLLITAAVVVPAMVASWLLWRWHNLLLLGDEAALGLGLDVARARLVLVVIAALVTGTTVAVAGAIGFVGLIVPHVARLAVGPDHRRLIPTCFLFGSLLLVLMDTAARTALAPRELPVGVLTGLLGAPFFLFLLRKHRGGESGF